MWTWILVLLSGWTVAEDANVRTLLYFESENCVACRKMRASIDQLRSEGYSIQARDTEREEAAAAKWRVHQIPTLVFLEDGIEVDRLVGAVPLATIKTSCHRRGIPRVERTQRLMVEDQLQTLRLSFWAAIIRFWEWRQRVKRAEPNRRRSLRVPIR